MNRQELQDFLTSAFPQVADDFLVGKVSGDGVTVALNIADKHLRPGGTVSGPSMFALVDVAMYLAILSRIGPKALAVTTNCSIDFMRKPASGAQMRAEARLLKLGRVLAVGDVLLFSDGVTDPVARASLTYSLPPAR